MTLQNMRYIIEIVNHHSFSAAAKALYISQSTLSMAVKDVEEFLGITIFHRSNRGITLTFDGEDFLKYAREIVEQSDYLEQRYQQRKYLPMRLSISTQRYPFSVRAFNRLVNNLNLSNYDMAIRECPTYTVIHDVASDKSELGILSIHESHWNTIRKTLDSNNIQFNKLCQLKLYVFMRKSHPLAHKKSLCLEELKDYAYVTFDQEMNHSHFTEEILFYELLDKNIHVSDRCSKIALIRGTDSFSIGIDLTNSNADAFHKGLGEIVAIPLKENVEALNVGYIIKSQRQLTDMAATYLKYLNEDLMTIANPPA